MLNASLARVAADLRLSHGWRFRDIAAHLGVSTAHAQKLARAGGWERPRWPLFTTRITNDGRAFFVRAVST
jgi:hypothetical protein